MGCVLIDKLDIADYIQEANINDLSAVDDRDSPDERGFR